MERSRGDGEGPSRLHRALCPRSLGRAELNCTWGLGTGVGQIQARNMGQIPRSAVVKHEEGSPGDGSAALEVSKSTPGIHTVSGRRARQQTFRRLACCLLP